MNVTQSVADLAGVGEKRQKQFNKLGIHTVGDLLFHVPRRYEDYTNLVTVSDMQPGKVSLKGAFTTVKGRYARKRLHITTALFEDESGATEIVWFNQPYRAEQLPLKTTLLLSGELKLSGNRFSIANPVYQPVESEDSKQGVVVPIYAETAGLTSKQINKHAKAALKASGLGEYPQVLGAKLADILATLHSPISIESLESARAQWRELELFEVILLGQLLRKDRIKLHSTTVEYDEKTLRHFVENLPFKLTDAQRRSAWEIIQDMTQSVPMNRLLQGDVGSGKTITAILASLAALEAGGQVAVVAPTEIVARQHLESWRELLGEYRPALLTSGLTARQKSSLKNKLKSGEVKLVVGTHAVLQPDVKFKNLHLAVIDEQHRFGVRQRQQLLRANNSMPHVLSMTATPIPRTLALTVFSDLDVSIIDAMPPGRKPVITEVGGPKNRKDFLGKFRKELEKNRQGYVVCPLIDESDTLGVRSVETEVKRLSKDLPGFRVEKLHGKLPPEEKQQILLDFKAKKVDVLVSTTVVEVGVNVPNATAMLIDGAERFGLSQLHQLRGRVGRAEEQAYCFAVTTKPRQAHERLAAFAKTTDGFKLAELDLKQRGHGELYGLRQSGFSNLDPELFLNTQRIKTARTKATEFIQKHDVDDYPLLQYRLDRIKYRAKRN